MSANCGNGLLDRGETCDTAVKSGELGACPTECDDGNACTADTLAGSGCNAVCQHKPVTQCKGGDGCCPSGCDSKTDSDCSAKCGNGTLDPSETCDTKIPAGDPGACPTKCDDGVACTEDQLLNANSCGATCWHRAIITCQNDDGCCPAGCDAKSDNDCSATCGNGVVEGKEACDTKIPAGQPGACPTQCDDGNACTQDALLGGGSCGAVCSSTPITSCKNDDGCCPSGCNNTTDNDCSATCGNGVLEAKETCDTKIAAGDPGACPTRCDDGNACTTDTLLNGGTCSATCSATTISKCAGGDGCCPAGCNNSNDSDCSASCGNGVVEKGEQCDTKIPVGSPGSCPTKCDDGKSCTTDALINGGTCSAQCTYKTITQCVSGDGCCPSGCNAANDKDCSATCGNGVVEPGELCDTKITAGQSGACPTRCSDGKSCTKDALLNAGTCNAQCSFTAITQCTSGDGCCPTGCNATNDKDCSATCGNGVVEFPELCDIKIPAGSNGACPTSCDDNNSCTKDALLNGGTCNAQCSNTAITQCVSGDKCCPKGCNANNDKDCSASCGNGVVEPGETCDTAIPVGTKGACPTACSDRDPCTKDTLLNSGTCSASCSYTAITQCTSGDKCCPNGCYITTDSDCSNCPPLQHLCNGKCVDNCSVSTCGQRCTPCTAPAYAKAFCSSCSTCAVTCGTGRTNCPLIKTLCMLDIGTGKDGAFNTALFPSDGSNDKALPPGVRRSRRIFTFNTSDTSRYGTYNFTSFAIAAEDTVIATGSRPLILLVQGSATVAGQLNLDGRGGQTIKGGGALGGAGGPAGGAGGAGAINCCQGRTGVGTGRGGGANTNTTNVKLCWCAGGCGGSFATRGGSVVPDKAGSSGCWSGSTYSWMSSSGAPVGGSGGGGSGYSTCSTVASSGGGGGGGGALRMVVGKRLWVAQTATVSARGGTAGTGGGGGSGGLLEMVGYGSFVNDGLIIATGGTGATGTYTTCTTRLGGGDGYIKLYGPAGVTGGGKTSPQWTATSNVPAKGCF